MNIYNFILNSDVSSYDHRFCIDYYAYGHYPEQSLKGWRKDSKPDFYNITERALKLLLKDLYNEIKEISYIYYENHELEIEIIANFEDSAGEIIDCVDDLTFTNTGLSSGTLNINDDALKNVWNKFVELHKER